MIESIRGETKADYLRDISKETYMKDMKDILERNDVRNPGEPEELLDYLSSAMNC